MKRIHIHFWIDVVAFVAFLLLTSTGVLMHFILPPGSGGVMSIWGLNRHEWGELHFWTAVVLFLSLVIHLALNWRWIVNVVRGHKGNGIGWRVALGIVALLALLALVTTPLFMPVEESPRGGAQHQFGKGAR